MAELIAKGSALGLYYEIFDRTGTVGRADTRTEVETSTEYVPGNRYTPAQTVTKYRTRTIQNIFLTDVDGKDHNVELHNFQLPCKEGHKITMFLLISGRRKLGHYFRGRNHNTRETSKHNGTVLWEMFPWKSCFILTLLMIGIILYFGIKNPDNSLGETVLVLVLGLICVGIPLWILGWILGFMRSISVRSNSAFKKNVRDLEQG